MSAPGGTALIKFGFTEDNVVERALAVCADAGRFGDGDLAAILAHQACAEVIEFPMRASELSEAASMQRSTAAWEGFGR